MLQGHSMRQESDTNRDWLEVLDEYGVQVLVLNRHSDGDLLELCQSQPAWTVDHEDGEAVLLVRVDIT
jgi:hypothetical protein